MYLATGPYGKIIPMAPVSLIVVGAGQRGTGYARWARRHPERSTVVAVAEPSPARRARLAAEHGITPQNAVTDWTELAGRGRLANAVLICTQDRMHAEPAEAFAALGYHILLEKPMAPDEAGCPADRGRGGEGRRHARRRPRDALHAVHARRQADRRLRPARRHHERPAPGAGRLLAPGPFLRPRQLAAQRPGDLHADGQVACHDLDWLQYILGRAPLRVSRASAA